MSEQLYPNADQGQSADSAACRVCGNQVVATDVGWTHVDRRGGYAGWVCPMPHMGLAEPRSVR